MSTAALLGGEATPAPAATETPAATSTTTETPAATTPEATPASNEPWYGTVENQELKGWLDNKGFKDLPTALESAYNMEKLIGKEKVPVPKDDDPESWNKFWEAAGRPKSPEDYGIELPEGGDPEFLNSATTKLHELGLNTQQARALVEWNNEQAAAIAEAREAQMVETHQKEVESLKKEWGHNFKAQEAKADLAMERFNISDDTISKITSGSKVELVKLLSSIGDRMQQDTKQDGGTPTDFATTKAGAIQQINALKADKDFVTKYTSGDTMAVKKWNDLHKVAYSE